MEGEEEGILLEEEGFDDCNDNVVVCDDTGFCCACDAVILGSKVIDGYFVVVNKLLESIL